MYRIEDYVRQAAQLSEQGYSIDEIARAMHRSTMTIERWLVLWEEICELEPPWFSGLDPATVACLRNAGIETRGELIRAWQKGEISPGHPAGIGALRLAKLRKWLEENGVEVSRGKKKAVLVDLTAEAEAELIRMQRSTGLSPSQIISDLILKES